MSSDDWTPRRRFFAAGAYVGRLLNEQQAQQPNLIERAQAERDALVLAEERAANGYFASESIADESASIASGSNALGGERRAPGRPEQARWDLIETDIVRVAMAEDPNRQVKHYVQLVAERISDFQRGPTPPKALTINYRVAQMVDRLALEMGRQR